jgi:hypothetical protein
MRTVLLNLWKWFVGLFKTVEKEVIVKKEVVDKKIKYTKGAYHFNFYGRKL